MKYARLNCEAEPISCSDTRSNSCCSQNPFGRRNLPSQEQATTATCTAEPHPTQDRPSPDLQLQSLPEHLTNRVLDGLPPDSLLSASQVCKSWKQLIQQDQYKCKRLNWHHKSFLEPGNVAKFRAKKRLLSCATEHRLTDLTERAGKTMLLQFA